MIEIKKLSVKYAIESNNSIAQLFLVTSTLTQQITYNFILWY